MTVHFLRDYTENVIWTSLSFRVMATGKNDLRMRQCKEPLWQQNSWVHISYTRGLLFSGQSGQACLSGWAEILKSPNGTMPIVILELIEWKGIMVPFICDFTGCSADVLRQDQPNLTSKKLQDHGQQNTSGLSYDSQDSPHKPCHLLLSCCSKPAWLPFFSHDSLSLHGKKDKWWLRVTPCVFHRRKMVWNNMKVR